MHLCVHTSAAPLKTGHIRRNFKLVYAKLIHVHACYQLRRIRPRTLRVASAVGAGRDTRAIDHDS